MNRSAALLVLSVVLCSSCGNRIHVVKFDGTTDSMRGVPYGLPMTVYTVTVTRHLANCKGLQISTEVAIAPSVSPDPSAMYTLYSNGWFSTSDIKSTFTAGGLSTGLNTEIADQTGPLIADVASTVATILPVLALARGPTTKQQSDLCASDEVREAVKSVKDGSDAVAKDNDELSQATTAVSYRTSVLNAAGSKADQGVRQALIEALASQYKAANNLSRDQKKLSDALKKVSDVQVIIWPQTGEDPLASGPFDLPEDVRDKWIVAGVLKTDAVSHHARLGSVYLELSRSPAAARYPTVPVGAIDVNKGVPVRFAVPGTLKVCDAPCSQQDAQVIAKKDGPVLQIGYTYVVPVNGGVFRSVTGAASMDAVTGSPTLIEVADKTAAATNLSGSIKSTSSTLAGVPAAISSAEHARIQAKIDADNAKANLEVAKESADQASTIAPVQAKYQLAQAELNQLNAEKALEEANSVQAVTKH